MPLSLLQRLKERKLVQWALAYLAGAWVLVEATNLVVEQFSWPQAVGQVVTILASFGFFVVLVIAWYHGEKGRQWVSGPELLMIALLLVIAGIGLSLLPGAEEAPEQTPSVPVVVGGDDRPSIAVLPFDNFSPDPGDAYFADGIQDEILSRLARISSLRVISRSSVEQYRQNRPTMPEIAATLGVEYVLEGSARVAGGLVRLTVQLIHGQTDEHRWVQDFDREYSVENLIRIHSEIAQEVTDELAVAMTPEEEARNQHVPTENLDAYEAYMLGRYHLNRRDAASEAFSEAVRYFEIAIQRDPDLAVAHGALADAFASLVSYGFRDPREFWPEVERWARSALALDTTVASAHLALALPQWVRDRDWEEAERKLQRAVSLSPSDPGGHRAYMEFLLGQGRIEEARQQLRIAGALDPLSSPTLQSQARLAYLSRDYEDAAELVDVLLSRDPENGIAEWYLGLSFLLEGRPEQVERLFRSLAVDSATQGTSPSVFRAVLLSLLGETDRAKREIEEVVSSLGEQYVDPSWIWMAYAALGDKDEAYSWMGRSIDGQSIQAAYIGVDPLADGLRDDPRYQAILDRIGLGHLKGRFDSLAASTRIPNP